MYGCWWRRPSCGGGCLALLAWGVTVVLPPGLERRTLGLAIARGVWIGAAALAGGLLARVLLQPQGWAERFWHAPPELCRFLRRLLLVGCVATLVLMVPYAILQMAPGNGSGTAESLLLARVCFLVFQAVMLVLVAIGGAPRSPLMVAVLARSRQQDGLMQRLRPVVYVLLLGGMLVTGDPTCSRCSTTTVFTHGTQSYDD